MRGIEKKVNVVVVSDHGMAPTSPEKTIFLEDYLDPTTMRVASWGQLLSAEALNGNNNALLQTLQKVPYLTAYRKCATPASFHYCQNRRISPVLALADEGWNITTRKMFAARANPERGSHGYDNRLVSMRAVFLASGPGLKTNRLIAEFENVHVYVLMCHLLGIAPAEHQGSLEVFRAVLD